MSIRKAISIQCESDNGPNLLYCFGQASPNGLDEIARQLKASVLAELHQQPASQITRNKASPQA
jgi:hypothetical protein